MATKNFAILIGGPGLFVDCDPKHDKNWVNYFKPMELAAEATAQASKFYGCGTKDFAEKWHLSFGVPTAGATYSITFAVLGKPGSDVFKLIESTPTAQGNPDWQTFP